MLVALCTCRSASSFALSSPKRVQHRADTSSRTYLRIIDPVHAREKSAALTSASFEDDSFREIASATVVAETVAVAALSLAGQRLLDAKACEARSGGAANLQEATMPVAMLLMVLDSAAFPSASKARKAVRGQLVRLNGLAVGSTDRAGVGDVVTWGERVMPGFNPRGRASFVLPVIFEDDDWAVVHKPAGPPMYAAPEGGHAKPSFSVHSALSHALSAPLATPESLPRPQPAHRLDRRTEGLLCVAKSRRAIVALSDAFAARTVRKEYHCVVVGSPGGGASSGDVEAAIDGRSARTTWSVLRTVPHATGDRPPLTLLAVWPQTGRKHQIRRHCAEALGCPIVGEDFPWLHDEACDGSQPTRPRALFSRKFYLCAVSLALLDPVTGATREFALPDPPKFAQLLRRHGALPF